MINIKNLNFKYKNKIIFNDFNLDIKNGITCMIGNNGCGKSTLAKILVGLLDYEGSITIDDKELKDNKNELRKHIGIVFDNPNTQFIKETVYDDIAFILKNMNYSKEDINNNINEIVDFLSINDLVNKSYSELNNSDRQLVNLAAALVHKPNIVILDEALCIDNKIDILKKLKKLKKTVIIISHDIEDTLISDNIVVIDDGKIVLMGNKKKIYKEEKLLNSLGYKLPFIVELSNRLMFYDLIDHTVYDMKEMVDLLWK